MSRDLAKNLWRTACRVAARDLRRSLVPLDLVRTAELPLVAELIAAEERRPGLRVLDIASPQVLSAHLAAAHPDWQLTYVNPFEPELVEMRRAADRLGLTNVRVLAGDAREPALFGDGSVDLVLCVSVLEHVEDTAGGRGDSVVMRNIARWLAPGGACALSVPFARQGFDEFTAQPVYAAGGSATGRPAFFQRFYDPAALPDRLIVPAGLRVEEEGFLGERWYFEHDSRRRLAPWLARRRLRFLLGRAYPWIGKIFLVRARSWTELRKPYIAALKLRKA